LVAKAWSCQANVFSSIVQDGDGVLTPHVAAAAKIFLDVVSTSCQVAGGVSSSPAFLKMSLL